MTTYTFTSHNLTFRLEGDGFSRNDARADFDAIAARVEAALDAMNDGEVARLHAAALTVTDGPEAIAIDDIAGHIKNEITRTWFNPNGAMVSLMACPA